MKPALHQRRLRRLALSPVLWRRRLVFWLGAIAVGSVASWFAVLADKAHEIFRAILSYGTWWPLVISPLVFAFSAYISSRYVPAAPGSGIPQAIAARILRDPKSRETLLGLRVVTVKMALTLLGLLAGASIGREGPSVQVGAGIMLFCAGVGGISGQRGVVLAGAAAGVAAAFNTPLAGIVFAIEEMARAFEHRNSSVVLTAIVLAGIASLSILGNYDYFGYVNPALSTAHDWPAILSVALLGGLCGGAFARALIDGDGWLKSLRGGFGLRKPILFAALCGLLVACIGILTGGLSYGTGYGLAHDLLHQTLRPAWWQMPAKFAATALSAISGIPGGIFSPSLSVGAALGGEMSQWFPSTAAQGIVLLGMVAYFAGVTQAPITSFVIVLEVTGKGTAALPLIASAVLAAGASRLICPESLYHALAHRWIVRLRTRKGEGEG